MRPYGVRPKEFIDLDCTHMGAPSRERKMRSKTRREARRILHKHARLDAKRSLKEIDTSEN